MFYPVSEVYSGVQRLGIFCKLWGAMKEGGFFYPAQVQEYIG